MAYDPFSDLESSMDDPLAISASDVSDIRTVPNQFPRITSVPYRLAIVGEAPGKDEIDQGKPFVGYSGRDLDRYLSRFGILRDACFVGNICQHRPRNNQITNFEWTGPEITSGLTKLAVDLHNLPNKPNVILLLGASALHAFKSPDVIPRKRKLKDGYKFEYPNQISDWRGSMFMSHERSPLPGVKCVAAYHPAACLRQYSWTPLLLLDVKRSAEEALRPELILPERELKVSLGFEETLNELDKLFNSNTPIGMDIEGYWNCIRCISFAPSPSYSFIVPFMQMDGTPYWPLDQECIIVRRMAQVLRHAHIGKVWQNGLYDRFCLQFAYCMPVCGINDDIMLSHWELHCEFEKNLGVQTSIYTREPYYKSEVKSNDFVTFFRYCCKDSALTKEIHEKLQKWLHPSSKTHYIFNRSLLNALLYMEIRGLRWNKEAASARLEEVESHIATLQYKLDTIAHRALTTRDKVVLRALLRDTMCYKRDASIVKKKFEKVYDRNMRTLLGEGAITDAQLGRLNIDMGRHLNVDSPDQLAEYLYNELSLPVQKDPKTGSVTVDYEALLTLSKKSDHPALPLIIDLTELNTRASMLRIATDEDGRLRSTYNEVGSETGRVTSSTSPTSSGGNLQTIPDENDLKPINHPLHRGMRDLVIADDDCYLAKCDLKGADGWTIGANLAALGDSTMLDDLRYGLKPAHFPCYARRHGRNTVKGKSRDELKSMFSEIAKSDWDYFAAKQCTWGFCYLMGERKAAQHVFNVSEGTVTVSESDMGDFKRVIFERYNIELGHKAIQKRIRSQPYPPKMVAPSGHIREFWGRPQEVLGEWLAHEPQAVTTYATNQAVYRCWTDVENRTANLSESPVKTRFHEVGFSSRRTFLRIEPLHQVHDEVVFQFLRKDVDWAVRKIKQWFDNEITIAGIKLVIPFEGAYGTNWAMDKDSKVGSI